MLIPQINMISIGLFVFFLALTAIGAQNKCSNSHANCVNIRKCPEIISILTNSRPLSAETLQTLRNLQCGFEGSDPKICCSQVLTTITTETPDPENSPNPDVTNHPNLRLLNHTLCGPIDEMKILPGNKTDIFQYPWMALISYDTGKPNPEFRCSGTVINSRYVLTAAHCVTFLPAGLRLIGVRVGDHDISKERDCYMDYVELVCAERYQDFGVESVQFHPEYMKTSLQNDIALIRLNSTVNFEPYNVKPICLPLGTAAILPKHRKRVVVTGWGMTELGPLSEELLRVKLTLVDNKQCKEMHKSTTQISYKQLCASQENVNFCSADSGGPLQAVNIYNGTKVRMIQYGVATYGLNKCGTEGFPGIYTNVAYYMDWILNTLTD